MRPYAQANFFFVREEAEAEYGGIKITGHDNGAGFGICGGGSSARRDRHPAGFQARNTEALAPDRRGGLAVRHATAPAALATGADVTTGNQRRRPAGHHPPSSIRKLEPAPRVRITTQPPLAGPTTVRLDQGQNLRILQDHVLVRDLGGKIPSGRRNPGIRRNRGQTECQEESQAHERSPSPQVSTRPPMPNPDTTELREPRFHDPNPPSLVLEWSARLCLGPSTSYDVG